MNAAEEYLPRHADPLLADGLDAAPIVMIDGPRAVGKTTSARRLARSVISLPHDQERLATGGRALLESLEPPVLIDEWQLAGIDVLWTLKDIVDRSHQNGRFLLTGSVEPSTYGPTYPLTGRSVRITMRPMTTLETHGLGGQPSPLQHLLIDDLHETAGATSPDTWEHVAASGFPRAASLSDPTLFLESYAQDISYRAGEEGRDASRLLRTMRVVATLQAQTVPQERIWQAADISKVTWKSYEDLLFRTHISAPLPAFESNRLKRITSYPKQFISDTALAMALAGFDRHGLTDDPALAGRYLESHVLQQIRPHADAMGARLGHLRTAQGEREIDVVLEHAGQVYALEVKSSSGVRRSDAKHMEWLRDQLGPRFARGLVLYTGADVVALGDRLWAVPIALLTQGL